MPQLKGIPNILSPDLLHVLASMGVGDEIVLADAHFPAAAMCRCGGAREIRADGHGIPELLDAILKLLPLDKYVENPVVLMDLVKSDKEKQLQGHLPLWAKYKAMVNKAEGGEVKVHMIDRFDFYDRAKKAYAVVHSGELAPYGNIILTKGVLL